MPIEEQLNELFNSNSVEELQKIVRKKRHDVERKKDELRYLVGERHRDVIEASDAIKDMKRLSERVSGSTLSLKDRCISQNAPPQLTAVPPGLSKLIDLSVAAHLKLLLDIPEMIWNFMDNGDHLSAVILFFFGRHISARLQLSSQLQSAGIDARVLVKRLWNSLVHMESAVVAACRRRLTAPPSNWKELCNSLVALVLMENVSLPNLIEEYLNGRMVALRRIFNDMENVKFSNEGNRNDHSLLSIRRQAILVGKFMSSTLKSAEHLFYEHPERDLSLKKGALQCELENLRNWSIRDAKWLPTERIYTYLSEDVRKFCLTDALLRKQSGSSSSSDHHVPVLPDEGLDMSVLHDRLASWWSEASDYCRAMLQSSLSHAPNLSMVVSIKNVILSHIGHWQHAQITEPEVPVPSKSILSDADETWFQSHGNPGDACSTKVHPVLQRPIELWTELFRDPFLTRITTLFNTGLDNYFDEWATQVLQLVKSTSELEPPSSDTAGFSTDQFSWNSFVKGSTDWAKYVWSDSKLDSFRTVDDDRASSCPNSFSDPTSTSDLYTTTGLTRILRPENVGLIVFCCLTGRPFPSSIVKDRKASDGIRSPPVHLLVFLQRLLSAYPVSLWVIEPKQDSENRSTSSSDQGYKSANLSHQLSLLSPRLQGLCETLNTRIANLIVEVVQKPGGDWLRLWTIILEGMERLLVRCEQWITTSAYESSSGETGRDALSLSASAGLILSRACSAFVDHCPAIGAAVLTAVGLTQSSKISQHTDSTPAPSDSSETRSFTWSDVNLLRSIWSSKREPLLNLADRLMLDSLINATVKGQPLVSFRNSIQSTFGLDAAYNRFPPTEPQYDDAHPPSNYLWDEEDAFSGGFDFGTVPFDNVHLQTDSAQLLDSDETVDHSAVAVLRVPSQISLPLHRTLLTVAYLIVRLAVHTFSRFGSGRTLCLALCHSLLAEYTRVVDQFESVNDSDQLSPDGTEAPSSATTLGSIIQPRALQLILDIQFITKLLVWPLAPGQPTSKSGLTEFNRCAQMETDVKSMAKQLLSRLETFVDPFDWEVCAPRLSTAVTTMLNGIAHLYAPMMHQGVGSQTGVTSKLSEASSGLNSANMESKLQTSTTLMPLVTASSSGSHPSFVTLPLGLASCFDKRRCKPGGTMRAKMAHGSSKLSTTIASKSSVNQPLSTSKPTVDSGFMHLGSMWFSS